MVEVPRVAKYRRSIGEVAFILLADCPQSVSMVIWDIKKMLFQSSFDLRIGLARMLSRFEVKKWGGMQGVEEDHS